MDTSQTVTIDYIENKKNIDMILLKCYTSYY